VALTFTAGTPVESTGSVTSTTVTLPAGIGAGDYTIICVAMNASSGTITTPAGWTNILASTATVNGSTSGKFAVFYRKWVSGDGSVAITTSSGRVGAVPIRVQGADQTTFVDVTSSVSQLASAITVHTAPTITPTTGWLMNVFAARSATNGVFMTPWGSLQSGLAKAGETSGKATAATNAGILLTWQAVTPGVATGTRTASSPATATGSLAFSFSLKEAVTGQNEVASVSLSGSGTLSATSVPGYARSASLSGSGTLTATATRHTAITANLSGSGTLTSTRTPAANASGTLSGSGTLTSTRVVGFTRTGTLSGTGALSGVGVPGYARTANLSGSGTLTSSTTPSVSRSASLSGSGTLSGTATQGGSAYSASVSLSGSGTLTGTSKPGYARSASLSGSGTLSGTAKAHKTATGSFSSTGTLSASVSAHRTATGTLSGEGTLNADATLETSVVVELSGAGELTIEAHNGNELLFQGSLGPQRYTADLVARVGQWDAVLPRRWNADLGES